MAEFDWFPASTKDPLRKYKQPKPDTHKPGRQEDSGYPQTDVRKNTAKFRGTGAATKGTSWRGADKD